MEKQKIISHLITNLHTAAEGIGECINVLNELLGEYDAAEDIAAWNRSKFVLIKNDVPQTSDVEEKEKPAMRRGESGILKFTEKEFHEMPDIFKRLYNEGVFVPHYRKQRNGSIELRCQIRGIKISATAKTKAEAKKKFIRKLIQNNLHKVGHSPLFEDYAAQWAETVKKPYVKPPTYKDYIFTLNNFLYPTFGDCPIHSIGQFDIQKLITELMEAGKARTAKKVYQILCSIFSYAEVDGYVDHSPMVKVKTPIYESESGKALTLEEERAFVQKCLSSETRSGKAFIFLLYTGLRRSELESAELVENGKFVQVITGKQRMGRKLKTRRIPLSPKLLRLLPEINLAEFKDLYTNRLTRMLKSWLPNHHLHELRHTFITRAQECGISRELVSLWAGHRADNTMTSNVYTHFSESYQLEEIKKFDY